MATIPITTLSPDDLPPSDKAIRAVVTLLWPYSSSTRQCALLLADPDFRLRNRKGQVRVRFTGASAEAVAKGKVGIGDDVVLDLRGARWAGESGHVSTPGKSVDGELLYRGELGLSIERKAGGEAPPTRIQVNESTPPPEQPVQPRRPNGTVDVTPTRATPAFLRSSLGGADVVPIYSSPAFVRRLRLSEEGSSWDPWADVEAELQEPASKKQRISLAGVARWTFAERSPSPEKGAPLAKSVDVVSEATLEQSQDVAMDTAADFVDRQVSSSTVRSLKPPLPKVIDFGDVGRIANMPPPPLPRLTIPPDQPGSEPEKRTNDENEGPSTPKLQPVPSSALPLPSPFPTESALPLFSHVGSNTLAAPLELEVISETTVGRDAEAIERSGNIPFQTRERPAAVLEEVQSIRETYVDHLASAASASATDSEGNTQYYGHDVHLTTQSQEEYMSDTEEDEEMYAEHLRQREAPIDEPGQYRLHRQHEDNYNDMSDVDEDEAEEVIEDMGEPPEDDEDDSSDELEESRTIEDSGDEAVEEDKAEEVVSKTSIIDVITIPEVPIDAHSLPTASTESQRVADATEILDDAIGSLAQVEASQPVSTMPSQQVSARVHEPEERAPPHTPARRALGSFGLDGASEMNTPALATPKSERDRIMSKTYSSLFGFKASPSPERQRAPPPFLQTQPPVTKPSTPALDPKPAFHSESNLSSALRVDDSDDVIMAGDVRDGSLLETILRDQTEAEAFARDEHEPDIGVGQDGASIVDVNRASDDALWLQQQMPIAEDDAGESDPINEELGNAIAPEKSACSEEQSQSSGTPLRPSQQLDMIDLDSRHDEVESSQPISGPVQTMTAEHGDHSAIRAVQLQPTQTVFDGAESNFRQTMQSYSATTQDSRGSALQSDMLDITQSTVDSPGIPTPIAPDENYTLPETVQDEPMPWTGPGQRSFSADQQYSQQAPAVQLPLTQQDTAVEFPSFQSATSVATDNSDNFHPVVAPGPAQVEEADHRVNTEPVEESPEAGNDLFTVYDHVAPPISGSQVQFIQPASSPVVDEEEPSIVARDAAADADAMDVDSDTSQVTAIRQARSSRDTPPGDDYDDDTGSMDEAESNVPEDAGAQELVPRAEDEAGGNIDAASTTASFSQFAQPPQVFVSSEVDQVVSEEHESSSEHDQLTPEPHMSSAEDVLRTLEHDLAMSADQTLLSELEQVNSNERPSYTHLPPSPEESQQRTESQPFETQIPHPAGLPPTPRLTQGDSLTSQLGTSDEPEVTDLPPAESNMPRRSRRSQSAASDTGSQAQQTRKSVRRSSRKLHIEHDIVEETIEPEAEAAVQSQSEDQASQTTIQLVSSQRTRRSKEPELLLSPMPATQVRRSPRKSQVEAQVLELDEHNKPVTVGVESAEHERRTPGPKDKSEEVTVDETLLSSSRKTPTRRSRRKPQGKMHVEEQEEQTGEGDDHVAAALARKTPGRKSFASRLSNVPDVISNWFSPRRPARQGGEANEETPDEIDEKRDARRIPSTGFVSSLGYYSPLSKVGEKLNPSSQAHGDNTVDVLAVVTDDTTEPKRAKSGPRDYSTMFRITDSSLTQNDSLRVEVFRPWAAVLPIAKAGDVVLLRAFAVKSKSRQPYLLSTDPSAWCVWRYGDGAEPQSPQSGNTSSRPVWAQTSRRTRSASVSGRKEQVLGPPVELTTKERERAEELRAWWLGSWGDVNVEHDE